MSQSPLILRERNETVYCVACHKSMELSTPLRCSRCKFVQYCSQECQRSNFDMHKKSCKKIAKLKQESNKSVLMELGSLLFCDTRRYFGDENALLKGKYLYEQALDAYVESYEHMRHEYGPPTAGGTDFPNPMIVPLRMRIPFLLAALGHDDLAVTEVHNALFMWSMGARRTDLDKTSDLMMLCLREKPSYMGNWPVVFLLPLLLVKLRLVLETRTRKDQFEALMETSAGNSLATAQSALKDTIVNEPTDDFLSKQSGQLRNLFDLILEPSTSFFDFLHSELAFLASSPILDEGASPALAVNENRFVKDAFTQDPNVLEALRDHVEQTSRNLDDGGGD